VGTHFKWKLTIAKKMSPNWVGLLLGFGNEALTRYTHSAGSNIYMWRIAHGAPWLYVVWEDPYEYGSLFTPRLNTRTDSPVGI